MNRQGGVWLRRCLTPIVHEDRGQAPAEPDPLRSPSLAHGMSPESSMLAKTILLT